MKIEYPFKIKKSVEALCDEVKKHYPEVFEKKFDSMGSPSSFGCTFSERMEMGLYIELMKAGVRFNENDFIIDDLPGVKNEE